MKTEDILAIDLGSQALHLARCVPSTAPQNQIKAFDFPSRGIQRGYLTHFSEVQKNLENAITRSEPLCRTHPKFALLGLPLSSLSWSFETVTVKVPASPVSSADLGRLNEELSHKIRAKDGKLVHGIPLEYELDGRKGVEDPCGFSAKTLSARFFTLFSSESYLSDLFKLINRCQLEVVSVYCPLLVQGLILAKALVEFHSHKKGHFGFLDLGYERGSGVVFVNGAPSHLFNIPLGGNHISTDISYGLHLPLHEAERIKRMLASPSAQDVRSGVLEIHDANNQVKSLQLHQITGIVSARLKELADFLEEQITPIRHLVGNGLYISGGTSETAFFLNYLKKRLNLPVFQAFSQPCFAAIPAEASASTLGAVSMLHWHLQNQPQIPSTSQGFLRFFQKRLRS